MTLAFLRSTRPRTAADWFAARLDGVDEKSDRLFQDWLAEDPSHGEEYALCEITWEVTREAAAATAVPNDTARRSVSLARRAAGFALAAGLAAVAVWYWPPVTASWSTAAGEQRTLVLTDGSRVTLNTRSRIKVRMARSARDVVLEEGEAFFEVAKDASRPFTVSTALGSARAVGTRFDVYLEAQRLAVTTEEGRVLVSAGAGEGNVMVEAGNQARLGAGMARPEVVSANVNAAINWLTRRLEVDDAPLGVVLEDFSRYTALPLRADTPAIANLRVSAVLRTGDIEALAATLKGAFGLELVQRGAEWVVIAPSVLKTPQR